MRTPTNKQRKVSCTPQVHKLIERLARQQRRTMQAVVELAVERMAKDASEQVYPAHARAHDGEE